MRCALCTFPTQPTDRLPWGVGVAHTVCALDRMLRAMKLLNRRKRR